MCQHLYGTGHSRAEMSLVLSASASRRAAFASSSLFGFTTRPPSFEDCGAIAPCAANEPSSCGRAEVIT